VAEHREPLAWAATRRALAQALGEIDGVLPGSVVVRRMRCGKTACACQTDPDARHGPYIQWTRTINGKTVTRNVSSGCCRSGRSGFVADLGLVDPGVCG
jgi:hypothetical protein